MLIRRFHGVHFFQIASDENHVVALGGKDVCKGTADPAGRAGEGNLMDVKKMFKCCNLSVDNLVVM